MAEYTLNGIKLSVPDTILTDRLRAKLESGTYEAQEAAAALRRIAPGRRVLDLGSGLGYIAALCASQAGPGNVVTVEANPAMLDVIRANLDRNGYRDVMLVHGAVAGERDRSEYVEFDMKKEFWGGRLAEADANPNRVVQVPRLRLEDLFEQFRPNVVIMDIEGAEQGLFRHDWPRHVRSVVLELHPKLYSDETIKEIVDCMSRSGLTYDHLTSCGKVLGFRRVAWGK